jgi:hypothetical protein
MIINNELKSVYKTFIDELFRSGSLSLPCKLLYSTSVFTECSNCYIDPITHKSSSRYKENGPLEFTNGQICPYCRGVGGLYSEVSDNIDLLVLFDYKTWINFNSKIHVPNGLIQTINKLENYTNIKNCTKLIVDTNIQNYTESYYQRDSEPEPCGFGDSSYFFTFWKKI